MVGPAVGGVVVIGLTILIIIIVIVMWWRFRGQFGGLTTEAHMHTHACGIWQMEAHLRSCLVGMVPLTLGYGDL